MSELFDMNYIKRKSGATTKINNIMFTLEVREVEGVFDCIWTTEAFDLKFYVNPCKDTLYCKVLNNKNEVLDITTRCYPKDTKFVNYYMSSRNMINKALYKLKLVSVEELKFTVPDIKKRTVKTLREIQEEAERIQYVCTCSAYCDYQEEKGEYTLCKTNDSTCVLVEKVKKKVRKEYILNERLKRIEKALGLPDE
jgi:hypothetical protein